MAGGLFRQIQRVLSQKQKRDWQGFFAPAIPLSQANKPTDTSTEGVPL
jgi:hypothetical protein